MKSMIFVMMVILMSHLSAEENGYVIFTKAFEQVKVSEMKKLKFDEKVFENGSRPSDDDLVIIRKYDSLIEELRNAARTKQWVNSGLEEISYHTMMPNLKKQLVVGKIAVLHSLMDLHDDKAVKAVQRMNELHQAFVRESRNNSLIQILVTIAVRKKMRSALATTVDHFSEAELKQGLVDLKDSYKKLIKVDELFLGEEVVALNGVKDIFRTRGKETPLEKTWFGIDQSIVSAALKKGISIKSWEEIVLQGFAEVHEQRKKLLYSSERELRDSLSKLLGDDLKGGPAKVFQLGSKEILEQLQKGDLSTVEKRHREIGQQLTRKLVSLCHPAIRKSLVKHRNYMAYERLLLIGVARRLYQVKFTKDIVSLNDLVKAKFLEAEMIICPHTNKTFVLNEKTGKVYSMGRDLKDDGGKVENRRREDGDVILIPF